MTVEFTDLGDGRTEVIVRHERFPADHDASPYRSGWVEGLDKLEALTTKDRSMPEESNTITIACPVRAVSRSWQTQRTTRSGEAASSR